MYYCNFVPNKHSNDNIIIAQEVIHSIRSMKGGMTNKINLENSYNRVRWEFMCDTFEDIGLPKLTLFGIAYRFLR